MTMHAPRGGGVRTNGGDGRDDFAELQLVENGGLSGGVKTNHQNTHLLLPPELVKDLRERETHLGGCVLGESTVRRYKSVGDDTVSAMFLTAGFIRWMRWVSVRDRRRWR